MSADTQKPQTLEGALFAAVMDRDGARIRQCLLDGADPNVPVEEGRSCFGQALWQTMFDAAGLMIAHGADVNYRSGGPSGKPLWLSIMYRDIMTLTATRTAFCLCHGADLTMTFDHLGQTMGVIGMLDAFVGATVSEPERASLRQMRVMVETELAAGARQRHMQLAGKRRQDGRRFKL